MKDDSVEEDDGACQLVSHDEPTLHTITYQQTAFTCYKHNHSNDYSYYTLCHSATHSISVFKVICSVSRQCPCKLLLHCHCHLAVSSILCYQCLCSVIRTASVNFCPLHFVISSLSSNQCTVNTSCTMSFFRHLSSSQHPCSNPSFVYALQQLILVTEFLQHTFICFTT